MATPVARAALSALLQDNGDHLHFDSVARLSATCKGLLQVVSRMRFTPSILQNAVELFNSKAGSISGLSLSARREALSEAVGRMVDDAPRYPLEDVQHEHLVTGLKNRAGKWPKKVLQRVEQRDTPAPARGPGLASKLLAACDAAWLDIGSVHRVGGAAASRMDITSGGHDDYCYEYRARFVEKLQMRGERAVRSFNDMRQELDEYDLFSGLHKGSLYKIDLDKRGPHLEFSAWGLKVSAAVVLTGRSSVWAGRWIPRLLVGHEPSEGEMGLDEEAAVLDVWFGEKCEAKRDDESSPEDVTAPVASAEASTCAEAPKLDEYERKLHVAALCSSGVDTVAVIVAEEVRRRGCIMFRDEADVTAALQEPKPRLYLQWWRFGGTPSSHEITSMTDKADGADTNGALTAELQIQKSADLDARHDVHSDLVFAGRTLACALACTELDQDSAGGWFSVIHLWDSQDHHLLLKCVLDCDILQFQAPPDRICLLACSTKQETEPLRLAIATRTGRVFALEVSPRLRAKHDEWVFGTDSSSDDEPVYESDFSSYFLCWPVPAWDGDPVELTNDVQLKESIWDFKSELPVKFAAVREKDAAAAELSELYGSWADVPENERVDTERPLQRVLGLHIDEHKLIVGRGSSFHGIADKIDKPGELTCWSLQKLDGGGTHVRLHWRLQPFSGRLCTFAVSSLFLVMAGNVAHDDADMILVWSVFGAGNEDGRPDEQRLCADAAGDLDEDEEEEEEADEESDV